MASTPEQTQASPTSESRVSVEQEVQHEASDGEPDMPPSKKPRKRKSRLLSGLNPSNILASPQSQAVANDEDDDASTSRTQSERRGKERPQREARLSNTRDQYDMKCVSARAAPSYFPCNIANVRADTTHSTSKSVQPTPRNAAASPRCLLQSPPPAPQMTTQPPATPKAFHRPPASLILSPRFTAGFTPANWTSKS